MGGVSRRGQGQVEFQAPGRGLKGSWEVVVSTKLGTEALGGAEMRGWGGRSGGEAGLGRAESRLQDLREGHCEEPKGSGPAGRRDVEV